MALLMGRVGTGPDQNDPESDGNSVNRRSGPAFGYPRRRGVDAGQSLAQAQAAGVPGLRLDLQSLAHRHGSGRQGHVLGHWAGD